MCFWTGERSCALALLDEDLPADESARHAPKYESGDNGFRVKGFKIRGVSLQLRVQNLHPQNTEP